MIAQLSALYMRQGFSRSFLSSSSLQFAGPILPNQQKYFLKESLAQFCTGSSLRVRRVTGTFHQRSVVNCTFKWSTQRLENSHYCWTYSYPQGDLQRLMNLPIWNSNIVLACSKLRHEVKNVWGGSPKHMLLFLIWGVIDVHRKKM